MALQGTHVSRSGTCLLRNHQIVAVDDFFRCIREGKKPLCDAEAGRNGALVALLGRKAIDEARVIGATPKCAVIAFKFTN